MKISIYCKDNENAGAIVNQVKQLISSHGHEINDKEYDCVLYIGGDGTFLRAVQENIEILDKIFFIGIHNGKLGFFYDYTMEDLEEMFSNLKEHDKFISEHRLLRAELYMNSQISETLYAVNEIRIENPFHTLVSDVFVDEYKLETFSGNGLIVCSSLGSTAYNRSLGGSLVCPTLDTLQITEIAPIFNRTYNSIGSSVVLSSERIIEFVGNLSNAVVGYDHLTLHVNNLEKIKIQLTDKKVKILHNSHYHYINKLRRCFGE